MEITLAANIDLNHPPETDDERYAVRQLKGALNQLGWYIPNAKTGMTDDIDENLKDALHAYQKHNTIFSTDTDLASDSTTLRFINEDLDAMERDPLFSGTYIWRTVGDDHVRGAHAVRNGQTYAWAHPPESGHPSEDYNCRCWAEPVNAAENPWKEWVGEREEGRQILQSPYLQNANAGALVFEGTVISVELCLRNGRCRTWLMQQVAKAIILYSYEHPPETLPAFPDAKKDTPRGSRKRWVDSKGKIYEWDYKKGEVEVYDKTGKKHLGGFDPNTGKQRSKPVKGRRAQK